LSPTARVSHSAGPCSTLCASEPPRRGMSARALVHVGRQVILSRRRARLVLGEEREPLPSKRARRGHAIDEAASPS